jgi:PAS domain-containing protein
VSEVTFAIGEVAAMLGISPHTIRAWERRHVVVRPVRTAAGQRRYTPDDVELLRQIKHERHVHGLSMRVATMTAQGLVVPDTGEPSPPAAIVEGGADPVRMVADLVSEVVVLVDPGGRIVHANTTFVRFCDLLLGQLRGTPFADLVDPFDRAKAVQLYQPPLRQRRGWELSLRTARRSAFFSFDCWPVTTAEGPTLVLVGRDLATAAPPSDGEGGPPVTVETPPPAGLPVRLRGLLDGVADPVRTLGQVGRWLEATPLGVVLTRADADLTVLLANRAMLRGLADRPAVEGRPLRSLWAGAAALAATASEAIAAGEPRSVAEDAAEAGGPVRDVEVCPVTDVGGAVTHLLLTVADVTAETAAGRRMAAMVAAAPALRRATDARQLLRMAARHAPELLPDAGSLVAAVTGRSPESVAVVAASGAWSRVEHAPEHELHLALVRDAIGERASIEVERATGGGAVETLRVVPLLPIPGGGTAVGALAFSRPGSRSFSLEDRDLIDEFASRLGLALGRLRAASPPRLSPPLAGARR